MTPIDWKLVVVQVKRDGTILEGHHSLVTPIDWKPTSLEVPEKILETVTTRW